MIRKVDFKTFPIHLEVIEGLAMIATGIIKVITLGIVHPDWEMHFVRYKIRRRIKIEKGVK